jgi:hypothetical protein
MAQWSGVASDVTVKLNTDYLPVNMTAQEVAELVKAWQSGAISFDTMFENLKRGEVVAESRTVEEEQELIGSAPVTLAE